MPKYDPWKILSLPYQKLLHFSHCRWYHQTCQYILPLIGLTDIGLIIICACNSYCYWVMFQFCNLFMMGRKDETNLTSYQNYHFIWVDNLWVVTKGFNNKKITKNNSNTKKLINSSFKTFATTIFYIENNTLDMVLPCFDFRLNSVNGLWKFLIFMYLHFSSFCSLLFLSIAFTRMMIWYC